MNIFLDTISPVNVLITFDDNRNIISQYNFDVKLNESTLLIEEIDNFLKKSNLFYSDINNFVVVNWPWSFTGVRTTVLLINTISFVTKSYITPVKYFDLFQSYPIIKTSSKRDSFVKLSKESEIEIYENEKISGILNWIVEVCWDVWFMQNVNVNSLPNYENFLKNIKLEKNTIISPFYLKKPNIS